MPNSEKERLILSKENTAWKKWGPYLSDRQWSTVREDYSKDGSAWEFFPHDHARSRAYRWGEDGIGGISDNEQFLCFAWAFWNGKDPILKERYFGLTGHEGNHGEDCKEYYYYLDSTPTHSYMRMLYKYPHAAYPYTQLIQESKKRNRKDTEFELIDTGLFDENKYFDISIEYAKASEEDILIKATIKNMAATPAKLYVLPTLWMRNIWMNEEPLKGTIKADESNAATVQHPFLAPFHLYCKDATELLFCENETNTERFSGIPSKNGYYKDGINEYLLHNKPTVNPAKTGSKMAALYVLELGGNDEKTVCLRLTNSPSTDPFVDFDQRFSERKQDADDFFQHLQAKVTDQDMRLVQRQAYAGLLWSKQFYYYNVAEWLDGYKSPVPVDGRRKKGRNQHWRHLENSDIISMPDKWEYPWYAAWDLAFHCIPFARLDPDFAKEQLLLFLSERYMHPSGQIPAYEWAFGDVNPPVHAWATLRVFHIDRRYRTDDGDIEFLERSFHKLSLNFTWWLNQKDSGGNNIFEGGFLGLDNIGVFDRSQPLPTGGFIEQADGTAWMAMYSLNMLRICLDLAVHKPVYEDMAIKYLEHFLLIAAALNNVGYENIEMWDDEDEFFYDVLNRSAEDSFRLKIRSMVGIIPMFAVETIKEVAFQKLPKFSNRLEHLLCKKPGLCDHVSRFQVPGVEGRRLLSLLRGHRMKKILQKVLDETEFLSDHGVRALSKFHQNHPYVFQTPEATFMVSYDPGESDIELFGGNSNWRGPVWFPLNYLLIESLLKFHLYYGDEFKIEYPTGSGHLLTIREVAYELGKRLIHIFTKDKNGLRPVYNNCPQMQRNPDFSDHILFYEYFHGDTGAGLGASHQTGWTALVADMIYKLYN